MAKVAQQRTELENLRAENAQLKEQLAALQTTETGKGDAAVAAAGPDAPAGGPDEGPPQTTETGKGDAAVAAAGPDAPAGGPDEGPPRKAARRRER